MLAASKGVPIKSVVSILNINDFGIISLADTRIKTPKDLEGKRIAMMPGDALNALFPAVLAANKIAARGSSRSCRSIPPAKPVAVMEKQADALLGGIDDQPFLIEAQGFKTGRADASRTRRQPVGITVLAHDDTIRDNPDLVRRFVKATSRAWEAARKDPDAAVDAGARGQARPRTRTRRSGSSRSTSRCWTRRTPRASRSASAPRRTGQRRSSS